MLLCRGLARSLKSMPACTCKKSLAAVWTVSKCESRLLNSQAGWTDVNLAHLSSRCCALTAPLHCARMYNVCVQLCSRHNRFIENMLVGEFTGRQMLFSDHYLYAMACHLSSTICAISTQCHVHDISIIAIMHTCRKAMCQNHADVSDFIPSWLWVYESTFKAILSVNVARLLVSLSSVHSRHDNQAGRLHNSRTTDSPEHNPESLAV